MKLFISHASEDKMEIAEPLAMELIHRGYDVWYDKFSLKAGDSLMDSIDEGLIECDFGIVILSQNFFRKGWTKKELNALISKEVGYSKKFIIPIWHKISHQELLSYSVMLADLIAVNSEIGLDHVVTEIEKATLNSTFNIPILQSECRKIARFFNHYLNSVWGGAVRWTPELIAVFGNDGYIDEDEEESDSFRKVQKFRNELKIRTITELAFGTSNDGYTWSMLIEFEDVRIVHELLWDCLEYNQYQRTVSTTNLYNMIEPFYETSSMFKQ
jgi:hypothetical protein